MTFCNWFLEIFKWKTLVSNIRNITFLEALEQSLSSLTASLLTPNRIGEYGAKVLYYRRCDRKKIMALNLLGNSSQMVITLFFGLIGVLFLTEYFLDLYWIIAGFSLFSLVFLLCYPYLRSGRFFHFFQKFFSFYRNMGMRTHLNILFLSVFRYLVFSHQFYFLLVLFGLELNYFLSMQIIFSMYFFSSLIPGFVALDFLIKGSVALTLFGLFGVNESIILTVTTLMWLLNFALPSILGSYYVCRFSLPKSVKVPIK
ncbi:hypothetical protein [Namhaeicola litoreus]|uniref:Lysylphosphatidylglycerol synthase TM region n=1 Tax=Namhaeicola litoreus TaxID=1052145 RepID=A0ABW3Y194_9FLAO